MCDCAETMQVGDRFMTENGIRTVRIVTGSQVVATLDDSALMEGKYNLKEIHRLNCPEGGYLY